MDGLSDDENLIENSNLSAEDSSAELERYVSELVSKAIGSVGHDIVWPVLDVIVGKVLSAVTVVVISTELEPVKNVSLWRTAPTDVVNYGSVSIVVLRGSFSTTLVSNENQTAIRALVRFSFLQSWMQTLFKGVHGVSIITLILITVIGIV